MSEAPDLSRIINLIMSNPDLVEKISALANSAEKSNTEPTEQKAESTPVVTEPQRKGQKSEKRTRLLYAMKPYLSDSRAKAIDSMMGIVDVIDMIRGGDT